MDLLKIIFFLKKKKKKKERKRILEINNPTSMNFMDSALSKVWLELGGL
jgi:hypothetical protein